VARFGSASLAGQDEPVRRYFGNALREGMPLAAGTRLSLSGRIKVGAWLPFTAAQQQDGRSFRWAARVGWGPVKPLEVVDHYADGASSTEGRLLGRLRLFRATGEDVTRSAAVRAVLESSVWAPGSLLPQRGVSWRAEAEDLIVASWDLGPERPEVRVRIDERGAVRGTSALRWGKPAGVGAFGYLPFGAEVHAERQFGDLLVPRCCPACWTARRRTGRWPRSRCATPPATSRCGCA
jgi:hypothetical protein